MNKLIEDISLRDNIYVFDDRADAGRRLSLMISEYKGMDMLVLAYQQAGTYCIRSRKCT